MTFEQLHNSYLEQDEPKIFGTDWKGHEIYEGDEYFDIMGEFVPVEDLEEFIGERFSKYTAGE
nr:MAG TPA: protein of unknown function (DUF2175) [Caudoviricetes sp.]